MDEVKINREDQAISLQTQEAKNEVAPSLPRGRYLAAASYLGLPALLAFSGKANELAKFHGRQGLALLFIWMILGIFAWIPWIGWIVGFFGQLAIFAAMFFGMRSAIDGKFWKIPIFGKYAEKIEI